MPSEFIVSNPAPIERRAFRKLEDDGALRVHTVLSLDATQELQGETFPSAQNINFWQLMQDGLKANFDHVDLRAAPIELISASEDQEIALEMMDRIDPWKSLHYYQRRSLYKFLVSYWVKYLREHKISHFYTRVPPHEVADYVLYLVCKWMSIRVVTFNYTAVPGYWLLGNDYKLPWPDLAASIRSLQDVPENQIKLSEATEASIARILQDYNAATPGYIKDARAIQPGRASFANTLGGIRKLPARILESARHRYYRFRIQGYQRVDYLEQQRKALCHKLAMTEYDWLPGYYAEHSSTELPDAPFVYYLLNFQPENTTVPLGGIFSDQLLAVATLAAALPEGWKVVVKEHPVQFFKAGFVGYLGRDKAYYDALLSMPGVQLASLNADHFQFLDSAKAVSTITGTVGWEALLREKPVIVFGEAWYQQAPGCFRAKTLEECKAAVLSIQEGALPDLQGLRKFAAAVEGTAEKIHFVPEEARWADEEFSLEQYAATLEAAVRKTL
ncbi:MAG: hypothetical protein KDK37_01130 [Leptospiraceae bacterium]|nr:hypothetical protein [Leptospiraceae bacterium]